MALIDAFAARVPFPVERWVNADRLGSTMNFGAALGRSAGDLVALADQDDVWAPQKLARLEAVAQETGAGVVFSDGRVIDEHGAVTGRTLWEGVGFVGRDRRHFDRRPLEVFLRRSVVTGAAMVVHRRVLDVALPLPAVLDDGANPMLQDRWISLLAAALGPVAAVAEPLIDFREHPGQQTGLRTPVTAAGARRELSRTDARVGHAVRARQLNAVADRLRAAGATDERLAVVEDAIAHLEARATLPGGRARRLPVVVREAGRGRYRRFSGGMRSAVADVVRPP
jgi:hypothetical protein